jgi:hypothetical protein
MKILSTFIFTHPATQKNYKIRPGINAGASNTNLSHSLRKVHGKNVSQNWKLGVALYAIERDAEGKPTNLVSVIGEPGYYHKQVNMLK